MATMFKTSCFLFWIIWMATLSFTFGVKHFERRYTYLKEFDNVGKLMTIACAITICMAALGCCCVKFDVMHVCCALWYTFLTLVGILVSSVFVMVSVRGSVSGVELTEVDLLRKNCCGVLGYKDYRAFILKAGTKGPDVPKSCCKHDPMEFEMKKPCRASKDLFDLSQADIPEDFPRDNEAAAQLVEMYYGADKMDFTNLSLKLPPKDVTQLDGLAVKGCYLHLKKNSQQIRDAYFNFCFILMACSIGMVILYIRNCLKARKQRRDRLRELMDAHIGDTPTIAAINEDIENEDHEQMLQDLAHNKNKRKLTATGGAGGDLQHAQQNMFVRNSLPAPTAQGRR